MPNLLSTEPHIVEAGPPRLRRVRHDSELGRWECTFREPDPRVRPYIQGWYQGWVEERASFSSRREVPTGIVPLIVNFGSAFDVASPETPAGSKSKFSSFVAGQYDSFALVSSTGLSRCVQVNFTPIGAYRLLRLPMDSLTNRTVELEDIFGRAAPRLADALDDASSWARRFDILDTFLLDRFASSRPVSAAVGWGWRRLEETAGRLDIGHLAREVGRSSRYLIERFRSEIGLPPKTLARVLRFNRALQLSERSERGSWARIAQECGYYDQAHLIRDFRQFAGVSPAVFVESRLPDGGGVVGD
jgi:AraC-like DNA-binding protein